MLPTDFDIFSSADPDHPVVHPDPREGHAARGLGLGDLVLVVGEDEVRAAAVDLEVRAEKLLGHRRALDVPAGAPLAPRRWPAGVLVGLAGLPEGEVERALLERGAAGLLALVHLLGIAIGELAVAGKAAHAEVDVPAGLIRVPVGDQGLDQLDDLADRLAWQAARRPGARCRADRCPRCSGAIIRRACSAEGNPASRRRGVDLVVDVGEVDDHGRVVALVGQEAPSSIGITYGRALPTWTRE